LSTENKWNTVWHWAARWGKLDLLQKIWDLAKDILTTEEIKYNLLLSKDSYGNTAWCAAVINGNLNVFMELQVLAEGIVTTEEIEICNLLWIDS
jgi:ankyrin repeat protein